MDDGSDVAAPNPSDERPEPGRGGTRAGHRTGESLGQLDRGTERAHQGVNDCAGVGMAREHSSNGREIRAAVVRNTGGPFEIETVALEGPRRDEVLVRVVAAGMCHTDMVARDKL